MADVKIKRKHTVKPSSETWNGKVTLSELDQVAGAAYVPTVYFYSKPVENPGFIIETLKEALSQALVAYYPLAGRLTQVEGTGRLELHCNAQGVELVEAESSSRLSDFGDFSLTQKFQHLIPFVDYTGSLMGLPLYMAQLTYLSCGGICLGIMISHAVADGSGLLYFINDWARLVRGETLEGLPCHDRSVLRAGEPPKDAHRFELTKSQLSSMLLAQQALSADHPKVETDMAMLPLSKAQVDKLKRAANQHMEHGQRPYSRYEVLAAHIWRCTSKARQHESCEQMALGIGIDARFRLSNFPNKYFGNTAFVVGARGVAGEIMSTPLSSTCRRIRETIEGVTEESIWDNIEFFKGLDDISICQQLRALRPDEEGGYVNPNPGVISWLSIPVCGIDFGWGKEVHMSPGTHCCDGVSILLSGRKEPGSVIVYMALQLAHLHIFKKHFYDDIV